MAAPLTRDEEARAALRRAVTAAWLADEIALTGSLVAQAQLAPDRRAALESRAADWVRRVRDPGLSRSPLDAFLREYDLDSREGVLLLCLAEALLRIPDEATAEKLIADKLGSARWKAHLGRSDSLFVNASTWGLMLTGGLVQLGDDTRMDARGALRRLAGRVGEPLVRLALRQGMRLMAQQFVMGRDIGAARARSREPAHAAERHSFDMLGEAALTAADAERYFAAYQQAIDVIGADAAPSALHERPGISVKLSALHPRYEVAQAARVKRELTPRLRALARFARERDVGFTVDAEEADRLELSLDVIEPVFLDAGLAGWEGFGLALQAYQKRALPLIDWLQALSRRAGRRLAVRLVKGAYWDTEIKRAQEQGLAGYPVFTRKSRTDASYLACARRLLDGREAFYPMLATHNAHTIAALHAYAGDTQGYELQRLHGMGEALHAVVRADLGLPCRVYAPVGAHEDLLPYLVRRLLENGANTSFVNRIHDAALAPERLVADPLAAALAPGEEFPAPRGLFGAQRRNSEGPNLADADTLRALEQALGRVPRETGDVQPAAADASDQAARSAVQAQPAWDERGVAERAAVLEAAADALAARRIEFLHLLIHEARKTLPDAVAEVREAEDFLRYYAAQARGLMGAPQVLPGPTGEENSLSLRGRGVFACISPWNFPLAIFSGQIAAALVSGNAVLAKPAEQTPRIALRMTQLLHGAGVPREVLHCLPGDGTVGNALVLDPRVAGVVFTGSFEVARHIQRELASREGALPVLVAETGGQNALIADSSALPEQLVRDVLRSAFGSAGQRCSALRLLYVQREIADRVIGLLRGAMRELVVGDPAKLETDVGPVIDADARGRLERHIAALRAQGRVIEQAALPAGSREGLFVAPCLAQVDGIEDLDAEHFGPVLHLARFGADELDAVVDRINAAGYGLTLGVHTRVESTWRRIAQRARVGNVYVNRGMTGAVVGSQPFGGEGLSGTGPKAGGPHYVLRFVTERALCVNTAAVGGNAELLRRDDLGQDGTNS